MDDASIQTKAPAVAGAINARAKQSSDSAPTMGSNAWPPLAVSMFAHFNSQIEMLRGEISTLLTEMKSAPHTKLLNASEAAHELKVKAPTVNAWCIEGRFPNAQSLGRAGWRIPLEDVRTLQIPVASRGKMRKRR